MTVQTLRARAGEAAPAVLLVIAIVVGVGVPVLGVAPTCAILAMPVLIGAAVVAVMRPTVMVASMVVIEVTNLSGVLADRSPVSIFQLSLALGLLSIGLALRKGEMRRKLNRFTVAYIALILAYIATQVIVTLGSQDVAASIHTLRETISDCLFFAVLLVLAQLSGRPWVIAGAFVAPLAVLSLFALINQVCGADWSFGGFATVTQASGVLTTTLRHGGPLPDSNFWGRHLVLGLPLAGALAFRALQAGRKAIAAVWIAAFAAILAGIYLTQSRGALIAAGIALLVWVVVSGGPVRKRGLIALVAAVPILFLPGIGNRLLNLYADVSDPTTSYAADPSVLGRQAAQEIAWAMFRDRPYFGFGPGAYESEVPRYAGVVQTAVLEPTNAAHNLYAQFAAEGGIVGLIGWAVFIVGFLFLVATTRVPEGRHDFYPLKSLTAAIVAALVAWSVASIFLHLAYFRTFAIVIVVAAAIPHSDTAPIIGRQELRRCGAAMLCLVIGGVAASVLYSATAREAHISRQAVTLIPYGDTDGLQAYALDVRSRNQLLPTYAGMMLPSGSDQSAVADPVRGLVYISAEGSSQESASARLDEAIRLARWRLNLYGADDWYQLTAVGEHVETTESRHSLSALGATALVGVGAAAASLIAIRVGDRSFARAREERRRGRKNE